MNLSTIISLSIEAIKERRTRSLLTILMISVGAGLMISVNGFTNGILRSAEVNLDQLAPTVIFVTNTPTQSRSGPGGASDGPPPTPKIIFNNVITQKIENLPSVKEVLPSYRGALKLESGGKSISASVVSIDPRKIFVIAPNIKFVEGSTLSNDRNIIVLGNNIANPPGENIPFAVIGQMVLAKYEFVDENGELQVNRKSFVVKAIIESTGNPTVDNGIIINLDSANVLMNKNGKYDSFVVVAKSKDLVEDVVDSLRKLYGNDIGITSQRSILDAIRGFTRSIDSFLSGIAIMALIVASVGIVTTLYTSVIERTREIGILRSIGAKNNHILSLFLTEAIMIGIIGATLGIPIGIGGGYVLSNITARIFEGSNAVTPFYNTSALLQVWVLSIGLSIIAGFYPAYKAAKIDPLVALARI
jgi:putative ABC transport system permease protein